MLDYLTNLKPLSVLKSHLEARLAEILLKMYFSEIL